MSVRPKFYSKSLTLMVPILEMVKEGIIARDIAKRMNLHKSLVSYYINKAKDCGFVKVIVRDVITILDLTQAGKNFLDQYNKNNPSIPLCRAENIQFKASIEKMPTVPVSWKRIQMHNWVQYNSEIDSVKVRLNAGKNPTLELIPSPVEGSDPFELYTILLYDCISVINELYYRIGLEVGRLKLSSRGEWLVYDPIARSFCKTNGQVEYEGIGKVNASSPRNIGEFEFYDPRALVDYLMMPKRLKKVEMNIEKIMSKLLHEN